MTLKGTNWNPTKIKNTRIYIRNRIIYDLMLSTGARISEILKLKTSDIIEKPSGYFVFYTPHVDDITDTRYEELGFKTTFRMIQINEATWDFLNQYIDNFRRPNGNTKIKSLFQFLQFA